MKNPNPNMLLRIAQADAYAAATEYLKLTREEDAEVYKEALKFERYLSHPRHNIGAGRYTDDTQMSLANAEAIINEDGNIPSRLNFAHSWVHCFHRDRRDGYARGFQKFLESTKTAGTFLADIKPYSEKNGAAMRSVPLGAYADPDNVIMAAEIQASITHNTVVGRYASIAVALLSHWALYRSELNSTWWDAFDFLTYHLPEDYRPLWREVDAYSWEGTVRSATDTVHAVFQALEESVSLMEALHTVVEWGGDTDTVASIVWGVGSSVPHMIKDDVPEWMEYCLEPGGKFGVQYLKDTGAALVELFG